MNYRAGRCKKDRIFKFESSGPKSQFRDVRFHGRRAFWAIAVL